MKTVDPVLDPSQLVPGTKYDDERRRRMHVHVGAIHALIFLAYYLIVATILRLIMIKYPESAVGKALAFIHG